MLRGVNLEEFVLSCGKANGELFGLGFHGLQSYIAIQLYAIRPLEPPRMRSS